MKGSKHLKPSIPILSLILFTTLLLTLHEPKTDVFAARPQGYVTGLVGHGQSYGLSCESRSAADVAAFWKIPLSEADILNALPRSDDPEIGFVGDVNGSWGYIPPQSYGVHAQPIARVLQQHGLDASARLEMPFEELQAEIDAGRPVIVWVIGAVWNGTPQTYTTDAGKQVVVAAFEHTMILIGYDENSVSLVNAGDGKTGVYPLAGFLTSWKVLNNMAVVVKGKFGEATPSPTFLSTSPAPQSTQTVNAPELTSFPPATPPFPVTPPQEAPRLPEGATQLPDPSQEVSYTVQPGDTLTTVADHFEISWQALAEYNRLPAPYVLYSGQILRIPRYLNSPTPSSPADIPASTPQSADPDRPAWTSYTVQQGDTLASLARRLHVKWQELAAWNRLTYPYKITPGQIIQIPLPIE